MDVNCVICGDCLEVMKSIGDQSVDIVLCDLPYGITQCKWDSIIPLDELWSCYRRICRGAIVLTASQPFTSALVMSNPSQFKHEWIWEKNRGSNFGNVKREPMKEHESVLVFAVDKWVYNPQLQERKGGGKDLIGKLVPHHCSEKFESTGKFNGYKKILSEARVPSSVQKFNCEVGLHPTQKPVALFEYLVRTYSNPGDLVLDNCAGSGTTGVACKNAGRNYTLIEKEQRYCDVAMDRLGLVRVKGGLQDLFDSCVNNG